VPARVSESFILRTYPFQEGDLVVSFLTKDQGKLRGIAKRARRFKSAFGAGLERLSQVRMAYFQRETRELVSLDSCELIRSQFDLVSDYGANLALDYFAEVTEQLLPAGESNEKFYRLLVTVIDCLREGSHPGAAGNAPLALTYYSLWAVRLSGWLPEFEVCLGCGCVLETDSERAFFTRGSAGLLCEHCRRTMAPASSWELTMESRILASEMLRKPVSHFSKTGWSYHTGADLRRFLVQQLEGHLERRLATARMITEEGMTA
jgi:DNA repair protein RecO (recombination protein O)